MYFSSVRTMKRLTILTLFCQICYSTSELTSVTRMQPRSPCENPNKNVLIEHFFNTIFTEFYSSPPVCVCVQMCTAQSTYCYPNGCLKSAVQEETELKTGTTQYPMMNENNKNHFMLLKGERDFMTEFLEQNYGNEFKEPPQSLNPVENMKPDIFKKKYSIIGKYNTATNVKVRPIIHDKVKKDVVKTELTDWAKTRWPMNTQNWKNGHRSFIEKPLKSQGTYFAAMLQDNEIADYPPKYFKRELAKTVDDDEGNIKAFYHLENLLNMTDAGKSFSLEKLIDNLIRSSFGTNNETTASIPVAKRNETKMPIEKFLSINSTGLANETTSVISINFTNENIDRNKYLDTSHVKKSANLNDMISILANRIEVENNTSMEIARRTIKDFDEKVLKDNENDKLQLNSAIENTGVIFASNVTVFDKILTTETTITTTDSEPETTTLHEVRVTKKNRQKVVKKASSKMNNPDINPKF